MSGEQLVVWTEQPLNAETPLSRLCGSEVTANELFFVRSHGPVPTVDPGSYRLELRGDVDEPLSLSLRELRDRFPQATVTATVACAGNRRAELQRVAPVPGAVPWGAGAIGNAVWRGVRLRDVLLAAGLGPEAQHVAFTGLDRVEANGGAVSFGGSVPLEKALSPEVLLAYEMNGRPLPPEHGFPLRAVVPGYIGARSVKWLATVTIQAEPSSNHFQARDYRLDGRPLAELPLNSAVCRPLAGARVLGPTVVAEGYAVTGGSRRVERVEVSSDGGETWVQAALRGDDRSRTWRLWRAELDVRPGRRELIVRAQDSSGARQPAGVTATWNAKGYMNNAWHRVAFDVEDVRAERPGSATPLVASA